jgi:hypothetical protein
MPEYLLYWKSLSSLKKDQEQILQPTCTRRLLLLARANLLVLLSDQRNPKLVVVFAAIKILSLIPRLLVVNL